MRKILLVSSQATVLGTYDVAFSGCASGYLLSDANKALVRHSSTLLSLEKEHGNFPY